METKKENKFYKSYSKLSEIKLVSIKLVQPSRITMWADKVLPGGKIIGEVLNANTVHYKTFKPYKGGLFCQRIFGPLKDFECACNKPTKYKYKKQISNQMSEGHIEIRNELDIKFDKIIKKLNTNYSTKLTVSPPSGGGGKVVSGNISVGLATSSSPPINLSKDGLTATHLKINSFKNTRKYCNTCQVQYTWSIMRRYQLGYIKLVSPVTHVWYLKGFPSYLSILLDMKRKELKSVIYCVQSTTLENILKPKPSLSNPSEIISSWKKIQEKIINQNTPVLDPCKQGSAPQVETLFNGINNPLLINSTNGSAADSAQSPDLEVGRRWGELSDLAKNKIEKRKKLKINKHKYFPGTFNSLNNYVGGDDFPDSPLKVLDPFKQGSAPSPPKGKGGLKVGLQGEKGSSTAYSTVNQSKDRFTTFMNSFWRGADNSSKGVITYGHEDFQNKKLNKININDFKKGFIFTKDIEQNPNNNYSNFRVKPDLKKLKKYFGLTDKINFKKLKILSLFIIQLKNQEPHRSPPFPFGGGGADPCLQGSSTFSGESGESGENGAKMVRPEIKKILKKMNIPYYILLNININNCSDSHIYNNFINIMWSKFMKTSLKNSLIRLNKILGQLPKTTDSPLIFDGLSGGDMTFASKCLLRTCFQVSSPVSSMDSHDSLVLFKEQKFLGLIIKSFNKLFGRTANDYFKFKFGRTATNLSKYSFIEEFYIKSNFNLELYTLSNFSTKINQFLIADFFGRWVTPLSPPFSPPFPFRGEGADPCKQGSSTFSGESGLDGKFDLASQPYPPLEGGGKVMLLGAPFKFNKYNSILKNLTKIFFKVFLQNLTLMLAKINTKALKFNLKENQNASISEDFKKNLLKILQRKEKIYNIKFTQNSILYIICFQKNDRANRHQGTQLNITGSKNHRCVPHSTRQNYPFPIIMENNQITKKELKILTNVFIDWLQRECVLMLDVYLNESFNFGCTSYIYRENLLPSINPWPGAVNPSLGVIPYGQKTDLIFKNKIDWYNNHYFMYSSDATYSYFKYYIHNKLNHFIYGVGDLQAPISKTGSSNIGLVVQPPAKTSLLPPHNPLRGVKSGKSGWEKDGGLNQKDKNNSFFKPGIVPQWISSEVMCTGEHFWDGTTQYGKIKKTGDSLILYPKRKFKRTTSDRWTIYLKRELGAIDINVDDKREFRIWSYAKSALAPHPTPFGSPNHPIHPQGDKGDKGDKGLAPPLLLVGSRGYKWQPTISEYWQKLEQFEKEEIIYKSKIYKKLTNITLSEYYEKREPLEKKKLDNFKKEAGSSNSTIKNKIVGSGYPQSFFSPPFSPPFSLPFPFGGERADPCLQGSSTFSGESGESGNPDGEKEVLPHLNINNIWESKLYNSHFLWIPIWDAYKDEMLSHLDLDMCFMLPSFSMGISQSSYAPTVNPIHPQGDKGDKGDKGHKGHTPWVWVTPQYNNILSGLKGVYSNLATISSQLPSSGGAMRAVSKTYRGGKGNKKFYNRTYIVSHKCAWDLSGWNKFNFLITSPVRNIKKIIPNYKHLFWGSQYTGNSSPVQMGNNMELVDNLNGNRPYVQKDVYLSGAGIIKQLLNEITYTELIKADTQYRLAYSQLDKQINRRINTYYSYKRSEYLIGFTGTEKILGRRIKKLFSERKLILKRLKFIRKFVQKGTLPKQMILTILPVLPPDLRPIIKMGDQIAASDLNRLYQRIIYRNDRLKKFLKDSAISSSNLISFAQRLLQEAVDNLIQNGKTGVISEKDSRGRPLKSLSDIIKGKQGRFRQFLLGKRVDYSGRSVIVVGPKLKLHECGIPKEMALELYLPFLLKKILNENLSKTVIGAKTLIRTNPTLIWELLRELMKTCPVLLNRAPTLHRLGIQAFQPKLIDGRAILLHPLVCSAFNADFDGDQMAVHIPITVEARTEAWKLMLSKNNILSPATGDPLAIPSQDMILGCYYLTTNILNSSNKNPTAVRPAPGVNPPKSEFIEGLQVGAKNKIKKVNNLKGFGFYYTQIKDVLKDYQQNKLELHSSIWLKWQGLVENGKDKQQPIEIRVDIFGNRKEIYKKSHKNYDIKNKLITKYILTTPGKILFNQIINK